MPLEGERMPLSSGKSSIDLFFNPKSVVVVGSMGSPFFGARVVAFNMRKFGFKGQIYLVNPKYKSVDGFDVYPNVRSVPGEVDLAVIITSAEAVSGVIDDCGEKGVEAAVVVADGFAERGAKGAALQKRMVETARRWGIRVLGPNTIGVLDAWSGVITNPYYIDYDSVRRGPVALVAQTGIIGPQAMSFCDMRLPLSKVCDLGNKCDVDESDILEYLGDDPGTKVIAMHLEDVKDGRRFMRVARKVTAEKPVIVLKPGKTEESARAVQSHTGAMAGNYAVYESAMKQAGILLVDTFQELLSIPKIFAYQPLPRGNRLGIVTITGGGGVMAIDAASRMGLRLAKLSRESIEKLASIHPSMASHPVDVGPAFPVSDDPRKLYKGSWSIVLNDENVDAAFITLYATRWFPHKEIAEELSRLRETGKPVAVWAYGPRIEDIVSLYQALEEAEVPFFFTIEEAIKALALTHHYAQIKEKLRKYVT
ncbi:MAG: CoA-binding protein [Candidatus Jordarchaeales archaeon]